jgi:NAD(P)-dependent dehydrogenase (short-subunit alcohol dehydrogenase family)
MRFAGKKFLVTGASSGIGRATAKLLSQNGALIVGVARDGEKLAEALEGVSVASTHSCDLSDEANVKRLIENLKTQQVVFDGMVHAAGVHTLRPLKILGSEELIRLYSSHVVSAVALSRYLLAGRLLAPDGASLVFLSSAAALRAGGGTIAYSSAKAALVAAVKTLAIELAPRKIRANAISPGVVLTPQSEVFMNTLPEEQRQKIVQGHPLGLGQPRDIANAAAFLLSEEARWITGENLVVDGGLTLQ